MSPVLEVRQSACARIFCSRRCFSLALAEDTGAAGVAGVDVAPLPFPGVRPARPGADPGRLFFRGIACGAAPARASPAPLVPAVVGCVLLLFLSGIGAPDPAPFTPHSTSPGGRSLGSGHSRARTAGDWPSSGVPPAAGRAGQAAGPAAAAGVTGVRGVRSESGITRPALLSRALLRRRAPADRAPPGVPPGVPAGVAHGVPAGVLSAATPAGVPASSAPGLRRPERDTIGSLVTPWQRWHSSTCAQRRHT